LILILAALPVYAGFRRRSRTHPVTAD
jgi:hypothetical protein